MNPKSYCLENYLNLDTGVFLRGRSVKFRYRHKREEGHGKTKAGFRVALL